MNNRLPLHYIVPDTTGDRLLRAAYGCKIEVLRFTDDDGQQSANVEFQLTGVLDSTADAAALLASLLECNRPAAGEGGQYV